MDALLKEYISILEDAVNQPGKLYGKANEFFHKYYDTEEAVQPAEIEKILMELADEIDSCQADPLNKMVFISRYKMKESIEKALLKIRKVLKESN